MPKKPVPVQSIQPAIAAVAEQTNLAPGVVQGIATDLARASDGVHGAGYALSDRQIADKWHVGLRRVQEIKSPATGLLPVMRQAMTERAFIMSSLLMDDMLSDLLDNDGAKLKAMDFEKKTRALRAITDAAVTFQDGHAAKDGGFNAGEMMKLLLGMKTAEKPLTVVSERDVA